MLPVPAHTRKMGCANSKAGDRFDAIMEISSRLQVDLTGPTLLGGGPGQPCKRKTMLICALGGASGPYEL